ncbi:hypothetical protein Kalk_13385 [Ketobacter alkanivorans]|uniref:RDD domain-containing protein n=1 Tax=Ketobacter alkanivorans TaxID=1917421 RepID=A0A2K9LRI4_9GAMM|nr:hypothetical protein Kalk_13385 [Ketobacter alkanivorans]MCP5019969.1 RDD family protein [Ketobacter sp.]
MAQQQIEHQYMGFWMRVLASILDNIWLGVIIAIVMLVLTMVFPMDSESTEYFLTGGSVNVLLPLVLVIALWIRYASTPGKMAFKAKIVDADTFEPVSNGRLILRYFGYFVSILPLFLGFLWICWDERKQGFHDKIAGTVVVIEK